MQASAIALVVAGGFSVWKLLEVFVVFTVMEKKDALSRRLVARIDEATAESDQIGVNALVITVIVLIVSISYVVYR